MTRAAILLLIAACGGRDKGSLQIAEAAEPVVDAWAEAVGGRDRLARVEAFHEVGTVRRNDQVGRYELWTTAAGARRYTETVGGVTELLVFDGNRGWMRDRAGLVRELIDDELDHERALAFWTSQSTLVASRRPGSIRIAADGSLVAAPRDSQAGLAIAIDPATHLPASYRFGNSPFESRLGDWRDVDGVRFPFSVRKRWGSVELEWHATTVDHAAAPTFERPADQAPPRLAHPVVVPFERDGGGPVITARLGTTTVTLVVDTSWTASALRRGRIAALGLGEPPIRGTLAIGDLAIADLVFEPIDDELDVVRGERIDGILGDDVLERFVVELDPVTRTLTFHDRDGYRHPATGTDVPLSVQFGVLQVDATLAMPGRPPLHPRMAIATNCACVAKLTAPFTQEHRLLDGADTRAVVGRDHVIRFVSAPIASLAVGPLVVTDTKATFALRGTGGFDDALTDGLLGAQVLERAHVVLDIAHGRLWLDPLVTGAGSD